MVLCSLNLDRFCESRISRRVVGYQGKPPHAHNVIGSQRWQHVVRVYVRQDADSNRVRTVKVNHCLIAGPRAVHATVEESLFGGHVPRNEISAICQK